ncbi:MAG: hypothetical protein ACW99G_19680 [Candidatus Thorarchaeota archaeon]|jgi:hypothetical protein
MSLLFAFVFAVTPISKTIEMDVPLKNTIVTIIESQEEISKAMNSEVISHTIDSSRPRWIINGDNPRLSYLLKGTLKTKLTIPDMENPVIIEYDETIEVGKRFVYTLESKENDVFNRLDIRLEMWQEDKKTVGTITMWADMKRGNSLWVRLFRRVSLTKLNRAIENVVDPPNPIEKTLLEEHSNQVERADRRYPPILPISG